MDRPALHPSRRGRARWTSTQSRSERWMACAARCGPATCSRPAQPQALSRWRPSSTSNVRQFANASELDAEAKNHSWIATIGVEQIRAEVDLLVCDADHGTDFYVRIVSANSGALSRKAGAQPIERRVRQLGPRVEVIIR